MKRNEGKLTICARCRNRFQDDSRDYYCSVKTKPGMDFVTGDVIRETFPRCKDKNITGHCCDYKKASLSQMIVSLKWIEEDI